jgi:hypothetical protein
MLSKIEHYRKINTTCVHLHEVSTGVKHRSRGKWWGEGQMRIFAQ